MTDLPRSVHSPGVLGASSLPSTEADAAPEPRTMPFEAVYDTYFPYVWRSVSRLGVPPAQVDDVVQETFLVVHRKLAAFEGRSSLKTWLYGIALRVARVHRLRARQLARAVPPVDPDDVRAPAGEQPDQRAQDAEAARIVNELLDSLEDDQREVFVLAELEQLSGPEIAEALGVKVNTVYSRLRLARAAFAEAAARFRARDGWRNHE